MLAPNHSDAAAALVEAANNGEWIAALDLVEQAFGVRGCILMGYDGLSADPAAVMASSFGMRRDRQEQYMADFAAIDFRNRFIERQPSGKIIHDYQIAPVKELERTAVYAEFLQPLDLGRFVGVNLGVGKDKSHTFFALAKANDSEPPTEQECAQVLAMAKLARAAVRTSSVVSALRARADSISAAVDRLDVGIALVTAARRIVECNDQARNLLDLHPSVSAQNGYLRFTDPEADAELTRLLQADPALTPGRTWIARGADEATLVVIANNISAASMSVGQPVVTLLLVDTRRQARRGANAWRQLFKLTASE
ncbi:MAG TPA: hypothetical protein PKY87_10885, partial [Terricaulis sp.]|nr:hypothetical protein [Terricaulis sp.]